MTFAATAGLVRAARPPMAAASPKRRRGPAGRRAPAEQRWGGFVAFFGQSIGK